MRPRLRFGVARHPQELDLSAPGLQIARFGSGDIDFSSSLIYRKRGISVFSTRRSCFGMQCFAYVVLFWLYVLGFLLLVFRRVLTQSL